MKSEKRAGSIVYAFRLIHDLQAGLPGAGEGLAALAVLSRDEGWGELERVCLFGQAVNSWISNDGHATQPVAALIEKSAEAGDNVMLALGLALRSDEGFSGTGQLGTAVFDEDLARATILLEQKDRRACERITAHTACAIAFGNRWLFELSHEQYELALAIGSAEPPGTIDFLLAPIRFNLAEEQVSWASKLFELGDAKGVRARWDAWKEVLAATDAYPMTESWRVELDALGLILGAFAGFAETDKAAELLSRLECSPEVEGRAGALLRLAIAIGLAATVETDRAAAASAVAAAVDAISAAVHPFMHDVALFLAATIEAREGSDAGLRYAHRVVEEQWAKRDASLMAMRAHIASVRLTTERDLLSRHARLDDLTGIANRRALEEFLSDLSLRGAEHCALILFDVDSFKAVNDRHGHLSGDRLLVRVAEVLARGIRASDLAVRLGGDEFAVILANTDASGALSRAEALVQALDEAPLDDVVAGLRLRVSAGVALGRPGSIMDIWAAADAALYEAKGAGGHVVRLSASIPYERKPEGGAVVPATAGEPS